MPVHIRSDNTRGHTVDPNVGGPQFLGQSLRQTDDARLSGGIGCLTGRSRGSPHGGNGDNRALPPPDEGGDGPPYGIKDAVQIYPHQAPPFIVAGIRDELLGQGDPSTAHQSVQSGESFFRPSRKGRGLIRAGQIRAQGYGTGPHLPQLPHQLQGKVLPLVVVDRHLPALFSKVPGGGGSDAP